jgi:hypothetical protein
MTQVPPADQRPLTIVARELTEPLDHPDQLVWLARDLLEVLLGEPIPPPAEVLPDLRPLLGKRLRSHARAPRPGVVALPSVFLLRPTAA